MPDSERVYKFVEFVGTSKKSWEDAAKIAINTATKNYSDIRIGEVVKLDVTIEGGQIALYRAKINLSYRYHL